MYRRFCSLSRRIYPLDNCWISTRLCYSHLYYDCGVFQSIRRQHVLTVQKNQEMEGLSLWGTYVYCLKPYR